MRRTRILLTGAAVALGSVACGAAAAPPATTAPGPRITVGSTDGSDTMGIATGAEQVVLANLYAVVVAKAGARVTLRASLGPRHAVEPALEAGTIDLYPDAAGSLLVFLDGADAALATQTAPAVAALREILGTHGVTVLDPAPAFAGTAVAVTRTTATEYHLTTVSSLVPLAGQLVLGGPPGCPPGALCQAGLETTYGLHFKSFTSLDNAGPVTVAALLGGEVQVAGLAAADGTIANNGFVALADDKHLGPADVVVPVIRTAVDTARVTAALDRLSAALTTTALAALVDEVVLGHADPGTVARRWVTHQRLR